MMGFQRIAISEVVLDGSKFTGLSGCDSVWNLNLDQIESGSGKVIDRVRVPVSSLGPSTYPFSAGTVLYSKLRPYLNKVVVADMDGYATTELVPLRCNPEKVYAPYLAHYLRSPEFLSFANTIVAGAKMPRMVMSEFWRYKIPLPPVPEQRRIAAILDQAYMLRAKRREALALLDELQRGIFHEMFGDPLTNPRGWPRKKFGELLEAPLRNGLSPSNSGTVHAKVLTLSAITGGMFDSNAVKTSTFAERPPTGVSVDARDFLICRGNGNLKLVGRGCFPQGSMPDVTFPDTMIAGRISERMIDRAFLAQQWASAVVRRQLESVARTTNGTHKVNQTVLEGISLLLPPLDLQREFGLRMRQVEGIVRTHSDAQECTDALFASLQYRAFRGEL